VTTVSLPVDARTSQTEKLFRLYQRANDVADRLQSLILQAGVGVYATVLDGPEPSVWADDLDEELTAAIVLWTAIRDRCNPASAAREKRANKEAS